MDLKKQEQAILSVLNNCTPLPKDLQLLIISYWRPTRHLVTYSNANVSGKNGCTIKWGSIPYDSRIELPPSIEVPCSIHNVIKFRSGFLLEHMSRDWKLHYYPDIYSTHYIEIPVTPQQHLAVVGKHLQTLIALCRNSGKLQRYDFEQKIWIDEPRPDCIKAMQFYVYTMITGDGRLAVEDQHRLIHLYDGVTWTRGKRNPASVAMMAGDSICYSNGRIHHEFTFESIINGQLIGTLNRGEQLMASTGDGQVLIYHGALLSVYDPVTGESIDVTNDDNRLLGLEDLKMTKLFPV